jgi:replication fork protection complex subunit Tof1/Swi1
VEEDSKFPPDVQVKKGYSWSEQLGIAIACLQENGQTELITWVKEVSYRFRAGFFERW